MLLKISEMCGLLFFFFLSKFTFITNIDVPTYFASMLQVCIFFFCLCHFGVGTNRKEIHVSKELLRCVEYYRNCQKQATLLTSSAFYFSSL